VLVQAAIEAGVTVSVLPGPSAVLTALAVSGLPTDRFVFEGFLPRKGRLPALRALAGEQRTLVFFESPHRIADALRDLGQAFGSDRPAAVCRELTKLYEQVVRGTVTELVEWASDGVRGELVVVVEGAPAAQITFPDAVTQVLELVRSGTRLKDAAGEVSAHTGHSSRELYQAALAVKG
jgi:16S rRNA (cytidine1402-2'-O)-methyltransferase